ncbi:MAG: LytR/AlgR family response regulator transcription factor [Butyrivibrio sp.]
MVSVAVCDDDRDILETVKSYISEYQSLGFCEFEVYGFNSGEELLKSTIRFDLIFLDIEMGGIDGIRTAQLLRQKDRKSRIVYITNHSECALRSYSVHPFDFIVKPVLKERITEVMKEFTVYLNELTAKEVVIQLKSEEGTLLLNLKDIYVFEYTGNRRVTVYTKKEKYLVKGGLSEIKNLIKADSFTSPHKSFIVNMEHIEKLNGFILYTTNGIEVPVAQKKLKNFQNEFSRFIKNYIRQE